MGNSYYFVGPGSGIISQPQLAGNGTAAAPSYSFSSAPTTGMYSPGTNQLGFSTNGVAALTFDASQNGTFAGALKLPLGTQLLSPTNGVLEVTNAAGTSINTAIILGANTSAGILMFNAGGNSLSLQTADKALNANLSCASVYAAGNGTQALFQTPAGGSYGLAAPDSTHVSLMANNVHALSIDSSQNAVFTGTVKIQSAGTIRSGAVTPNTNVTGSVGDVYTWTGGGAGTTFWVKESGAGTNTGWVGK